MAYFSKENKPRLARNKPRVAHSLKGKWVQMKWVEFLGFTA